MKHLNIIYTFIVIILIGCSSINGTGGTIDETIPTKNQKIFMGKVAQVNTKSQEITVNGFKFNHSSANIIRNLLVSSHNSIKAGQILTIETSGQDKEGVYQASDIEISEQLVGPIESINSKLNTIQVLGQTIFISGTTNFSQKNFSTLTVNNYLSIFGYRRENGDLDATLIEFLKEDFTSTQDTVKISGEVSNINLEQNTIEINRVVIQLNADEIKTISNGDYLTLDNLAINNDVPNGISTNNLNPSILKGVNNYQVDREIVLEGISSQILAKNIFNLNGYQVFVPIDLLDADSIESIINRKLIIEGVFVGKKEILAKKILVEEIKDFELRGLIEDASEDEATEEGFITIFSQKIIINKYTSIDFELEDILLLIKAENSSYIINVKGYVDSNGSKVASSVSLKIDETDKTKLISGKIESIENGFLKVSKILVKLNETIEYENEDTTINSSVLLELLTIGDTVELFGEFNQDGFFMANSLEKLSEPLSKK